MKKKKTLYEDMKAMLQLLGDLGRPTGEDEVNFKDLKDLGGAGGNFVLTPKEIMKVHANDVEQHNRADATSPGRPSKMQRPLDTYEKDDYKAFTDTNIEAGSKTSLITALQQNQDALAHTIATALNGQLASGVDEAQLRDEIMHAIQDILTREG